MAKTEKFHKMNVFKLSVISILCVICLQIDVVNGKSTPISTRSPVPTTIAANTTAGTQTSTLKVSDNPTLPADNKTGHGSTIQPNDTKEETPKVPPKSEAISSTTKTTTPTTTKTTTSTTTTAAAEDKAVTTTEKDNTKEENVTIKNNSVKTTNTTTVSPSSTLKAKESSTLKVGLAGKKIPDITSTIKLDESKIQSSTVLTSTKTKTTLQPTSSTTTVNKLLVQPDVNVDENQSGRIKKPIQTDTKMPAPEEDSSSHFMAYFLTFVVLCIAGYIIYHNKQKILAFILEGRKEGGGTRRRPSTKEYKQLKTEEVMPSLEKSAPSNKYVY